MPLDVSIDGGIEFSHSLKQWWYHDDINLTLLKPTVFGPLQGNTKLFISGTGFAAVYDYLKCKFESFINGNYVIIPAMYITGTLIECYTPSWNISEIVSITVTRNGYDYSISTLNFTYHPNINILSFYPTHGPLYGNTELTIISNNGGSNFSAMYDNDNHNIMDTIPLMYRFIDQYGNIMKETYVDQLINDSIIICKTPSILSKSLELMPFVYVDITLNGLDYIFGQQIKFNYTENIVLHNIFPTYVPILGGSLMHIDGENFLNLTTTKIKVNNSFIITPLSITNNKIIFETPQVTSVGMVQFEVTHNGYDYTNFGMVYFYHYTPYLSYLSPTYAIESSNESIRVHGINFVPSVDTYCLWTALNVTYSNTPTTNNNYIFDPLVGVVYRSDLLYCPPPPIISINAISKSFTYSPWNINTVFRLQISFNTIDYTDAITNSLNYTILPDPSFTKLSPIIGPKQGRTLVTIYGNNFNELDINHMFCKFGDFRRVSVITKTDTTIECISPRSDTKRIVYVYVHYRDIVMHFDGLVTFEYYEELIITDIYPNFGPKSGGTKVSLYGHNFIQDSISCFIDNITTYTFEPTFISRNLLTFITPPYLSLSLFTNNIHIECSNNNQNYRAFKHYFYYVNDVIMTEIYPSNGPELGNTKVIIKGFNFMPTQYLTVRVHDIMDIHPIFVDNETLIVYMPGIWNHTDTLITNAFDTAISVDLSISNNGQDWEQIRSLSFTYYPQPTCSIIDPTSGYYFGGTKITVFGSNFITAFNNTIYCRFFGFAWVEATVINTSAIECITPFSDEFYGETLIEVTLNSWDFYLCDSRFTYLPYPLIENIYPIHGPIEGGTVITIYGQNLNQIGGCCRFDGSYRTDTPYNILNDSHVQCTTPKYWNKMVSVQVSPNCKEYTQHERFRFHFYTLPKLHSVFPVYIHADNDDIVTLSGSDFGTFPSILIKLTSSTDFNDNAIISNVTVISSNEILFIPIHHATGIMHISISLDDGANWSEDEYLIDLIYLPELKIYQVSPITVFPLYSTTLLTISGSGFANISTLACYYTNYSTSTDALIEITTPAIYIDSSRLMCNTPSNWSITTILTLLVQITVNGIYYNDNSIKMNHTILFTNQFPTISNIFPTLGPLTGNTKITVNGSYFTNTSVCNINELSVTTTYINPNAVICITNSFVEPGISSLKILDTYDYYNEMPFYFYHYDIVNITSIWPSFGPPGTVLTVTGSHFVNSSLLSARYNDLDDNILEINYIDPSHVTIIIPSPLQPMTLDISISLNNQQYSPSYSFDVTPLPTITSIQPNFGIIGYRYNITIIGSSFPYNIEAIYEYSRCWFTNANNNAIQYISPVYQVINSSHLTCLVPEYNDTNYGMMNFTVQISFHDHSNKVMFTDDVFKYIFPPEIINFTSSMIGPVSGNSIVHLTGMNTHSKDTLCVINNILVIPTFASNTNISCIVPEYNPLFLTTDSVKIVTFCLSSKTFIGQLSENYCIGATYEYRYYLDIVITSINPSFGFDTQSTWIELHGVFEDWGNYICKVKETGQLLLKSDHNVDYKYGFIRCLVPPQSNELYKNITIEIAFDEDGIFYDTNLQFEYLPTPSITSISPNTIYPQQNITISVVGANFDSMSLFSQNWFVIHVTSDTAQPFISRSDVILALQYVNSTLLYVDIPPIYPADNVSHISPLAITIWIAGHATFNDIDFTLSFYNDPAPNIHSIHPIRGPIEGNTIITVNGTGFKDTDKCVFNTSNGIYETSLHTYNNSMVIQCLSPQLNINANNDNIDDQTAQLFIRETATVYEFYTGVNSEFWYYPTPIFTEISPNSIQDIDLTYHNLSVITLYMEGERFIDYLTTIKIGNNVIVSPTEIREDLIVFEYPLYNLGSLDVALGTTHFIQVEFNGQQSHDTQLYVEIIPDIVLIQTIPSVIFAAPSQYLSLIYIQGFNFYKSFNYVCKLHYDNYNSFRYIEPIFTNSTHLSFDSHWIPINNIFDSPQLLALECSSNNQQYSNIIETTFLLPPYMKSIYPPFLDYNITNKNITIIGEYFTPAIDLYCKWTTAIYKAIIIDSNTMICYFNGYLESSTLFLHISLDQQFWINTTIKLELWNPITISSLQPSSIAIDSVIEQIIVTGQFMYRYLYALCIYNEVLKYNATYLSSTQWICPNPPVSNDQNTYLSVQLSDNIRISNILYISYVFASLPTIGYIEPNVIRRATGEIITVYGSGFSINHQCLFYPTQITAPIITYTSNSIISCFVPPSTALTDLNAYKLQIVNSSGYAHPTDINDAIDLIYIETPYIKSYVPTFVEVKEPDYIVDIVLEVENATEPVTCVAIFDTSNYYYNISSTPIMSNTSHVVCKSPVLENMNMSTNISLTITAGHNKNEASNFVSFWYLPRPYINSLYPPVLFDYFDSVLGSEEQDLIIWGENFVQFLDLKCR
eukprot:472468_1